MSQQLYGIVNEPLFQVFLDVRKAYNSPDGGRCLEILRGYGLGLNLDRLLTHYWERQRIVPKAGKFLRKAFGTGRGVTQVNPTSPMIFNVMVDAVERALLDEVFGPQEAQHGLGLTVGGETWCFLPTMEEFRGGTTSGFRIP